MPMFRLTPIVIVLVSVLPSAADEGRIPIWEPTTIDTPGRYFLTRDLIVSGDNGIEVDAVDVTLDLNGYSVRHVSRGQHGILLQEGSDEITVRNGRVSGWSNCIGISGLVGPPRIRIEDMDLRDCTYGIHLREVETFVIRDNHVSETSFVGILVQGVVPGSTESTGLIEGNLVTTAERDGIQVSSAYGAEIRGNVVSDFCTMEPPMPLDTPRVGLSVHGKGNRIVENVVFGSSTGCLGVRIIFGYDSLFENNVVVGTGLSGIEFTSWSILRGNVAAANGEHGLVDGELGSSYTLFDGNHCVDNGGIGIDFDGSGASFTNAYRNNMLRGNAGGPVNPLDSATDEGGNIE